MTTDVSGVRSLAPRAESASQTPVRRLFWHALTLEAFLLALVAVAPLGGIAQTISPLARAWPWLLLPARALFGELLATASVPPGRAWPQLALFALLLVGASVAQGLALLVARQPYARPVVSASSTTTSSIASKQRLARIPRLFREHQVLILVMGATLVFGITFLLLPSLPSDDVFSYILYGRISAVHGANPLIATPADFPNDPFLSLVFWRDVRSVYGPVWLLLSSGLSLLAQALGGSLVVYVLLFKLVGLAAHLGNALLIWAILGRLAPERPGRQRPGRQLLGTLLYAWNPLCLLEFCASAHNDAVMLFFLLLAVYCLVRDAASVHRRMSEGQSSPLPVAGGVPVWALAERPYDVAALLAFGLSISTKYLPLILLPFYAIYVGYSLRAVGTTWWRVALAVSRRLAVIFAVVALTAVPYWAGPRTLGALLFSPPAQQLDNSLLESVSWPLRALAQSIFHLSASSARTLVDNGLKIGALLIFVLLWLRELRRATSFVGMLTAWGWVLLWYAVVASGWFWPWYVTWGVAVVALLPWGRLSVATLLLAGGALTLYGFLPLQSSPLYGDRSIVAFGPVLIYLLLTTWRQRRELLTRERTWWTRARQTITSVLGRTFDPVRA